MKRRMSSQQMERQLGLQYAKMLQETQNQHFVSVSKECEDISRWLDLLNHNNKAAMVMQNKRVAGAFV
jgi:hypothetical protein